MLCEPICCTLESGWQSFQILMHALVQVLNSISLLLTPKLLVSLILSCMDYCNCLLAELSQSWVGKLQSPEMCSPSWFVTCSPCTSTCSQHSNHQTSSLVACQSPNFLLECMALFQCGHLLHPCLFLWPSTSSPWSLRSSADTHLCKIPLYRLRARQKVIMLSLSLVFLSGTHCHRTLEMLQLPTPSSLL